MAITAAGAELTEAHRVAQARIGAQVSTDLITLWSRINPARIEATFPEFARTATAVINQRRTASTRLAGSYLAAFREFEAPDIERFAPILADTLPPARGQANLAATGRSTIYRRLRDGADIEDAMSAGRTAASRNGLRLALEGGRETITRTIDADPAALGVMRITSGDPCSFCAMLASRGPVYLTEASASFKPHDGCHCQPEIVYGTDTRIPDNSEQYRQLWREATAGKSGKDAANAFRRAFERPRS